MQVILTEKVDRLGNIGDVVRVKDGFARNFLLPRRKAIRATESNLKVFEVRRAELEKANAERKALAEKISEKVEGIVVNLIRQASEEGRLYGSVTARDIAEAVAKTSKQEISAEMIVLNLKFKEIGMHDLQVALHPDVKCKVSLNIARSEEEANVAKKAAASEASKEEKKAKAPAKKKAEAVEAEVAASEEIAEKPKKKAASKKKDQE